jgi:trichothecene 3-O-acetyltransferase
MALDEIHVTLNSLDYIPPRNYVRVVFPFPLKPGVEDKVVFNDLHEALHKTFVQEPWVSGKVFRQALDTPGWRPGQLEICYRPYSLDGPRPYQLRYQQLDTDWTYADLRDSGFPSDIFPEELLLNAPRLGDVDVAGADIFLAQANFLQGGLLLGMTASHAAMDAAAMLNITKLWAENFRELHNRDAGGEVAPSRFTPKDRDRTLPDQILEAESGERLPSSNSDDSWLRGLVGLDSDYPGEDVTGATQRAAAANGNGDPLPPRHPCVMLNRVMFLSSSDLAALQKECATEPLPAGASPFSVSDAINALLWRGVMKARAAAAAARSSLLDNISVLESPVDVRNAFARDFPPDYLGNCFLLSTARIPLVELIAPSTSLGRIAQVIHQGAARLDSRAVHDAYALLRSTADLARVQGRFVERPESADFLVSNIIFYPMSEINFGDRYFGNGGTPQTLRVLHAQYAPYLRLAHVLPRNASHGGVELSVNLFDEEMVYFEADEEMNKYLVPIKL